MGDLTRPEDCVTALLSEAVSLKKKAEAMNRLIEFNKKYSEEVALAFSTAPVGLVLKNLRLFVIHPSMTVRSLALKAMRLMIRDPNFVRELSKKHLDHFIARCIDVTAPNTVATGQSTPPQQAGGEKEAAPPGGTNASPSAANGASLGPVTDTEANPARMAAMNLIIALSTNSATNRQLPPAILEALREIVKTHDDPCCRVALDALLQMAIQNPDHAAKYGVLTPLVEAIIDPYFKAMQESLVLFVLYLLDSADTRCYLTNLSYILAPLTGAHFPDQLEVTQLSIRTVTLMLKSWPGIIWAVSQGACQAMVTAMTSSDPKRSSLVIDALFEIFRTPNPGSSNPFQRQGVVVLQPHDLDVLMTSHDVTADAPDRSRSKRQNIMLNYLAVVLSGFIDAGLIEALIELGTDSTDDRIKVTVLLADVLELSNNLLSPSACTKLQQAPDLVKKAVSFRMDPQLRSSASTMITNLYKYSNTKNPLSQDIPITTLANATRSSKDHRLDRIDEVRRKIEWELDEAGLQQRLRQTNVLQYGNKDWARWKWDSISELIEGPLRNPVFLQATLKLKFFKRFLSFFRPSKKIFSELPWAYENMLYVRTGCQALELLAESDEGKTFLQSHALIKNLAELISSEAVKRDASKEQLFWSPERMLKVMAREYFTLLGVLARSDGGLEILRKYNVFAGLKALCDKSSRDDLVHVILTSLDYEKKSEECLQILQVGLSNPKSPVVRYLATRHLRVLLRQKVTDFNDWGIDLLKERVTQPDPDVKVRNLALQILDEACDEEPAMLRLINSKVLLNTDQLGPAGRAFQIRLASVPLGFKFLHNIGWITTEMEKWMEVENANYVEALEKRLAGLLSRSQARKSSAVDISVVHSFNVDEEISVLPHLFGELAKTEEGCKMLKRTNVVSKFLKTLKSSKASSLDRRAAIWAIGHIASSPQGLNFLGQSNVVELLVEMTETDSSLSIRGTCFYVLGLISVLPQVREVLARLGWESPFELSARISLPTHGSQNNMFKIPELGSRASIRFADTKAKLALLPKHYHTGTSAGGVQSPEELRSEILNTVVHLSTHVGVDAPQRALKRLKAKHPEVFADPLLLFDVFRMLEAFSFRIRQRKFVCLELFDDVSWTEDSLAMVDKRFGTD